jgi:histidine ammonia-lyase
MQEDHVSMGWSAARKLRKVIDNLTHILGIELLTAARAVELRKGLKPAKPTQAVISELRKVVDPIGPDRFLSPELEQASLLIKEGRAVKAASAIIPTLI